MLAPFSGLYVPVHLFPDWLRTIAYATPFPSLLQFADRRAQRSGARRGGLLVVAMQVGLAARSAGLLTRVMIWRATRRLVVQGG